MGWLCMQVDSTIFLRNVSIGESGREDDEHAIYTGCVLSGLSFALFLHEL